MAYRILSMDGGGIRGILTVRLLERIEAALPGFVQQVDLFAGTSTGGLLTVGLGSGLPPREIRAIYEDCGSEIFADSLLDNIKDLGNLIGAQYNLEPLKRVLVERFGDTTLAELPKRVLVSAFDLDNEAIPPAVRTWKMKFFHNYPGPDSDGHELVVDVAMRTSVAPTYFPIYQGYIDGGVAASNPSTCALAQALHRSTGGQQLSEIRLLSLGTGYNPHHLESKDGDWGLANWAPHLVTIMLESGANMADYQCQQILEDQYLRVNPALPHTIEMDQIRYIPELVRVAEQVDLDPILHWIKEVFLA